MNARTFVSLVLLLSLWLLSSVQSNPAQAQVGPAVGSSIRDFALADQHGSPQKLSELLFEGPIALIVIKSAGWCAESKEFVLQVQQEADSFDEAGLKVVCLSYDSVDVIGSFASRKGIKFPLLADPKSKVIKQLKLVNSKFKKGTLRHGLAHPTTILIDRERNVIDVAAGLSDPRRLLKLWESKKSGVNSDADRPDFISVKGNKFVDEQGSHVLFKGVAIADPSKILGDGHWDRKHFHAIKKWGANIIRIPVHPGNFRKLGEEKYLRLLDQAIQWCEEYRMYAIIDWHSTGNLKEQKFEAHHHITSMKETLAFWDLVSSRYADNPTVAFYEVFNEPAANVREYPELGDCTWAQWKLMVEKIIDAIRANDKQTVTLVGGFDWAYDLRDAADSPIAREGVAYVAHPYPGKSKPPREPHWEEHFGFLASRFPIFATEMGYYNKGEVEHFVDDGSFRDGILKYLDQKKISWCAWTFDPDWSPALIDSYDYAPTDSGRFFKNAMSRGSKVAE